MIAFLGERYPGDVQTRGLWLWSGGNAKDIPYSEAPEKRWDQLWALAEKEETNNAPQNLIQEALLDTPSDKFLIDCLVTFSKTTNDAINNDAGLLVEILEHWGEKLEFDSVLTVLLIFSECSVRDGLTALVPPLSEKINEELRDKWEPWFQKIKKERQTGSVRGILSLLDLFLDSLMKNSPRIDSEKFHVNAAKVKAYLEKALKNLEDVQEEDKAVLSEVELKELLKVESEDQTLLEELTKEFLPFIGTFGGIDSKRLESISLTAFTAIQKIFELSKTISSKKTWPPVQNSAETCFKSIWATIEKKTEDETTEDS